ncbi:hypothetical protein BT63DRAFT_373259 [Microthyrium microscopicum]|uniref:N-acetylglucosamine-induced protein 1 n=1 Tax=Microthyrium microscopicum TaxID=703497 RepID=A0A6A6UDM9_9PEZI|nr:hypothetical protein BT63DRAFT_373259 [Microthyrium microscopicum]
MPHGELPYWHFNIPSDQRSKECPSFLQNLSDKDKRLIGTWDADYEPITWDEATELIRTNRIDRFRRPPTELRQYRGFVEQISHKYGSPMKYILEHRLRWKDLTPIGQDLSSPEDWKILVNDWPYGFADGIEHLVVWTKSSLPDDPVTGSISARSSRVIEEFVADKFPEMPAGEVIWFKNWRSLKSVHAIEHFHVLLHNPPPGYIEAIVGDDKQIGC